MTAFLTEMDGFNKDLSKPVFVLAATNFDVESGGSKSLDPALMRRFDRRVLIDLPNKAERRTYLEMKINKNNVFNVSDSKLENIVVLLNRHESCCTGISCGTRFENGNS